MTKVLPRIQLSATWLNLELWERELDNNKLMKYRCSVPDLPGDHVIGFGITPVWAYTDWERKQ